MKMIEIERYNRITLSKLNECPIVTQVEDSDEDNEIP
jgi:hypothetical protein